MTPAAQLAAVLMVVRPDRLWMTYEAGYAWVQEAGDGFTSGYRGEKFKPDSKDDLARVVAMLTPEQRSLFNAHLDDPEYGYPTPSNIVLLAATVWLDALEAAVEAE